MTGPAAKPRRSWWKTAARWLAAGLFLFLMLRWFERAQVYVPSRAFDAELADSLYPGEEITLTAGDGVALHAWFFPATNTEARASQALLYCHGNGGNISHRLDTIAALRELGVNAFIFDYRGYGRSRGRPGEAGTYLDAEAAYQWLRRRGFEGRDIVLYGESLGGGVASELALRVPVGGLCLQSTFTSIPDIGAELFPFLPVRTLASIRYDTHARLPRIRVPVVFLHSRNDTLIRFGHAQRNFAAANEPKALVEIDGDHNDPLADRKAYQAGLVKLLDWARKAPSGNGEG